MDIQAHILNKEQILEQIKTLDKKDQVEICLEFLIELSQNWYNAKELCKVYCTEQTCGAAERYRLQVNELKQRILELNN